MNLESDSAMPRYGDAAVLILLTLLALGLWVGLDHWQVGSPSPDQSAVAKLVSTGAVSHRFTGTLDWQSISTESPLFVGDSIYVPSDVEAKVVFARGDVVTLDPNSMIQISDLSPEGIGIVVLSGAARSPATIPIHGSLSAPQRSPKSAAVELLPPVPEEDFLKLLERQRVLLAWRPLPERRWKAVTPEPIDKIKYFDVRLANPPTGSHQKSRFIRFSWSAVPLPGMTYEFEMSPRADFQSPLIHITEKSALGIQVLNKGNCFWRVRAKRQRDGEILSESRSLVIQ